MRRSPTEDGSCGIARSAIDQLVPLLEDALAALGEADTALRVQLLSRLAAALRGEPSRKRRERIFEQAIQGARRIGDPATLAYALSAAEAALHGPDNAQGRLAEGAEIVSLAAETGDQERLFDGHEHSFWAAWEVGDPERRARELASMTRVAEELRQPAQRWILAAAQATLAVSLGRFAEAAELIPRAAAIGERVVGWSAVATRKLQLFVLRREQGRLEGFEQEVRDHAHEFPSPLVHQAVLADVYARVGHADKAGALLNELTSRDLLGLACGRGMARAASACLRIPAQFWETRILPPSCTCSSGPTAQQTPSPSPRSRSAPPLGRWACSRPCCSRFDEADRHFEQALQMNERMGARPWVAHTQEDQARMLLRRNAHGDRERAESLLSQARATYAELGMWYR